MNHLLFVARKVKYRDRVYLVKSLMSLEVGNKELSLEENSIEERGWGRGIQSNSEELEN